MNTLESICSQMERGLEVILVNDCSSDPMPEEVNQFIKEHQVIYVCHEQNRGLASARNTAIQLASGEYFAFCDDDDAWPKGFALRLISVLENSPSEISMAIALSPMCRKSWQKFFGEYPKLTDVIKMGVTPPVSSQAYQTAMLQEIGGYEPKIQSGVDHDLWLSLAKVNPRVGVSWGETAVVNNDPKANRMTTIEGKRRTKIAEALKIWHPKIVEAFGEDFYRYFCNSYNQYLNYSFFIKSLKKRDYITGAKKILNSYVLARLVEKIIYKAMGYKPCNSFPNYKN